MILPRPNLIKLLTPLAVFAAVAVALAAMSGGDAPAPKPADDRAGSFDATTAGRIAQARSAIRAEPSDPRGYSALGSAYLQLARETGDPRGDQVVRAERAFDAALRRDPRDADPMTGLGVVALSAHDFERGLRYGGRALELAPHRVRAYPVIIDAQIELGRYEEAGRSLQRLIDLKPNLASYARASYYRELHGDLDGALEAMRLAVSAGGDAPEQVAYVQTLLGDLQLDRARVNEARGAYTLALARLPDYVDARFGLARAQAQAGDLPGALRRLRGVVADRPDPDHLVMLAEVELRLGRRAAARRHIARARARERQALATGSSPDAGVVLLEAQYGDPARAVRLGRQVWRSAASVTSADAFGWALTSAGRPDEGLRFARRALRLGTNSPAFHYHAGVAAARSGRAASARSHLRTALRLNPRFSPVDAPRARRLLARLG
jgi:tetratricopeptide (TPR) repeat protein